MLQFVPVYRVHGFSFGLFLPFILISIYCFCHVLNCNISTLQADIVVDKRLAIILFVLALLLRLYIGMRFSYVRAVKLESPAFDYGIFVQLMENIVAGKGPVTTLERGYELSHWAVHFSPSLYLLAPFYWLLKPLLGIATLNIIQVIVLALATWPAYLWLKELGATDSIALVLTSVFLLSPFQIFGVFYDFHENCLLPLAIFAYLYFRQKGYLFQRILAAMVILGVKEDAFIYLFTISIFYLIMAWRREDATSLLTELAFAILSIIYFFSATAYIRSFGLDIMVSRFANLFDYTDFGLKDLMLNLYLRPDLGLLSVFSPAKQFYIFISLMTSALVLLWGQKPGWIMIIPMVFINLLSNWQYQTNLSYQYHFGTQVLLLVLLYEAFAKLRRMRFEQLMMLILTIASCVVVLVSLSYEKKLYLETNRGIDRMKRTEMINFISKINKDERIVSSTFLTPILASEGFDVCEFIYLDRSNLPEYLLLDTREYLADKLPDFINSYEKLAEVEGALELWRQRRD
ncbi:MAG: DUF2079 domain-containing protein [Eubacteriales bacterium]|nr:DUF2079 domain-containing protein [Eubacteriales bacterium]